ncbi:MAG: hypothetical protein EVA87_09235 [Rhodospirillaceae bacterium]|nr:MAG: hypothetical protein EVA87_09235 [Rhodospirillaceae bacterium]
MSSILTGFFKLSRETLAEDRIGRVMDRMKPMHFRINILRVPVLEQVFVGGKLQTPGSATGNDHD